MTLAKKNQYPEHKECDVSFQAAFSHRCADDLKIDKHKVMSQKINKFLTK